MNRILNLLDYAVKSLLRRWRKNTALVLIYTLVVAFFASVVFFTSSLKYETQAVLQDIPELWLQKITGGRLELVSESLIDSLSGIRGVKKIIPRIWGYYFDTPTGAVFTIIGSDLLIDGLLVANVTSTSSVTEKLDSTMALCGTGFLETHLLETGQRLTLIDAEGKLRGFSIVGAFTAKSDLLTRDLIILSKSSARKILGLPEDKVTDIGIAVWNDDEVDNIGRKIDRKFHGIRVVTRAQLLSTYETLFSYRGGIFIYGAIISLFAFLILAWDRAAGLSREDKKELGILKGIGWQINDVLWMKFWEGIVISLNATLLGIIIAWLHVFVWHAPLLKPFLIGWSVMYPEYQLHPVVDSGSILMVFLLSVIPYLTATIIPAWRGAVTDPAEVMQNG